MTTTNAMVFKQATNATRVDWTAEVSLLAWPDKAESVELHHSDRTYVRRSRTAPPATNELPNLPDSPWAKVEWEGKPAELLSWTNGPQTGSFYITSPDQVFPHGTTLGSSFAPPTVGAMVGTLVSSNRLLVRSEVTNEMSVPLAAPGRPQSVGLTNLHYVMTSTLKSIVLTNVSAAEFEIPPDYREVADFTPQPITPPPDPTGPGPSPQQIYTRRMEELRKGVPPVTVPATQPFTGRVLNPGQ